MMDAAPDDGMIRAFFRLLSMIALSIAVIMAVLDATRSIAADALVLTPLGASWLSVSPATLESLESFIGENLPAFFWDPVAIRLLSAPGFMIFAALALLLYAVGHRPRRRPGRFVLEN